MKKYRSLLAAAVLAVGLGGFAASANAANIVPNTWYTALFTSNPSPLTGPPYQVGTNPLFGASLPAPAGTSWTINLTKAGKLLVTDLEESGDRFMMYDNATLLGTTSSPCYGCNYVGSNITAAWNDANFSHGVWNLGAGLHTLSGTYIGSVGFGDASFAVAVPEPASWVLMFAGLGGAGMALRARRRQAIAAA